MKEPCFRCKRPTYFNDKMGPLKDGALFHKGCFKCWICGTRLSLKTYHNNRNDTQDLEVYCAGHVPSPGPHDPIPHRSNLLFSPKTRGDYPHNLMRSTAPN
ncbi:hillarin [Ditylenchus destructor]|nr:hillarin [Ditylenchus destructor]